MLPGNKTLGALLVLLLLRFIPCYSQQHDTSFYSIIMTGYNKGSVKIVQKGPGSYERWYQYNDRGRGDSLHSIYREDEEGFPVYLHVEGKDYFKKEVAEDFSLDNGNAQWKNSAEQETRKVNGKAFYISLLTNGGNIIKALASNNNKIQLLPFGEATMEIVNEHTVGTGSAARKLRLCSVSGLNSVPDYYWADAQHNIFGITGEWFSIVPKGYEKYVPELIKVQQKIEDSRNYRLARELPEKVNGNILIKDVTLFDAVQAQTLPHTDVLISKGRILEVSSGKPITAPAARIIDGRGHTLIPGLWDMHVHFSEGIDGLLHLAAGVTHVRDMGNDTSLLTFRNQINRGQLIGPRIEVLSGLIDRAGPLSAPTGALINNPEEGKKAVKMFADKGYQQIKLYSSMKPEWVKPLIAEARKYHLRVCGHIPAYMTASQAIAAGYDEITHMNMLLLNFFGDTVDTRTPQRFLILAEKATTLDLNSQEVKDLLQLMKTRNIASDPTLVAFEPMYTARDGKLEEKNEHIVAHMPVQIQRQLRAGGGGLPVPPGKDTLYRQAFGVFLQFTKLLYDNGIRIVAGTDGTPGFDMYRELELYVKAGIPPAKVLQLATYGTAVYTGKSRELGSIAAGKVADMVLIGGDPAVNISDVRRTRLVIKDGVIYDPAKLYKALAIQPF
ncbi:amidohydrolase family protein [Chitinophaga solisilvae]|uniref:amidohydrolase family protein n=1 Tax=Chitinophaga solisilvae TaxID=1233460 RepID=UPI00136C5413|nr:amidohydrolase family protein [Chitinophaga solisilvae]